MSPHDTGNNITISRMTDKEKLIYQLFIGKVSDVIGIEMTSHLLQEAKNAFADYPKEKPK